MMKQLLLAFFLLIVCAAATPAQSAAEQAARNARDQFSNIKNRSIELERMKRDANKRPAIDNSAPQFPKIKEDFEEIQKLSVEALRLTDVKTPVNYTTVLHFVSEINQRAVRLKSNLFSAETEQERETKNKQQIAAEPQDIKTLLEDLDKSIKSFAHNSIFQNIILVNSQDSLKAQNDLETVIKLSSSIKEKAKKLKKGESKN
jgi:hypothetical protein